jgi:hypothetical protein
MRPNGPFFLAFAILLLPVSLRPSLLVLIAVDDLNRILGLPQVLLLGILKFLRTQVDYIAVFHLVLILLVLLLRPIVWVFL